MYNRPGFYSAAKSCFQFCPVSSCGTAANNSPEAQKAFSMQNVTMKKIYQTLDRTPQTANNANYNSVSSFKCKEKSHPRVKNFNCFLVIWYAAYWHLLTVNSKNKIIFLLGHLLNCHATLWLTQAMAKRLWLTETKKNQSPQQSDVYSILCLPPHLLEQKQLIHVVTHSITLLSWPHTLVYTGRNPSSCEFSFIITEPPLLIHDSTISICANKFSLE